MAKKIRPSSKYWRSREEAQRRKNIKDQKEYDKQIKSIYQKSMDNIQKEIDSFYARYAKKEGITLAEAKKRASKLDMEEYSRKAKRYVAEKDFSKQANEEMRLYNMTMKVNRLELLKAKIGLELVDGFNDLQKFFDRKLTDRTLDEFKRQAGILGDTVTDTEAAKRAKVLVNASFHNAKWSDRIWMHQDLLKNKLDGLLRTGLIQGRNPRELARELRKAFGASVNDSERLMRTEMARVQTAAQQESFERNGFKEYEYICCGLPDACEICRALDGKIFKVKDMMVGENAPPMHPNCHCSTAAAAANREDFDAWLDAKAAGETGLGFEEWSRFNKKVKENGSTDLIFDDKMKLYRKGSTNRYRSEDGIHEVISKALYHKITAPAIKAGAKIQMASPEYVERMKSKNSRAVTLGDTIIFRKDVTTSDVLEEVFHFWQNHRGRFSDYGHEERELLCEIEAKEYLLSVTEKYNVPVIEQKETEEWLKIYQDRMKERKERGEWNEPNQ